MPTTALYLQTWGVTGNLGMKVAVDATQIQGYRGVFGPALLVPIATTPFGAQSGQEITLHSLEGVLVWNTEHGMMPGIRIPSQIVGSNTRHLQVPVTDEQIEEIEKRRNGEAVAFRIALLGLATVPNPEHQLVYVVTQQDGSTLTEARPRMELRDLHAAGDGAEPIRIEREQWLKILESAGFGTRRLVELPQPSLPTGADKRWDECLRLLNSATESFRTGRYEDVLSTCRKIIEGVTEVLCNRWGSCATTKSRSHSGRRTSRSGWLESGPTSPRMACYSPLCSPPRSSGRTEPTTMGRAFHCARKCRSRCR